MRRSLCCLAAALALAACGAVDSPRTLRGAQVDPDDVKQLVPGTSTKKDVEALIGSPTSRGTFDDRWIYISQQTHTRVGRLPGVDKQDVLVLAFDQKGVLQSVQRRATKDAKPVTMVARTTPSPGSEATFMQQLLGNIGRFNPTGVGGGPSGPGNGLSIGRNQ